VYNAGTVFVFEVGAVLLFSSALICDVYAVDEIINDSLLRKVIFIREDLERNQLRNYCDFFLLM
jgi:hypothetical protein